MGTYGSVDCCDCVICAPQLHHPDDDIATEKTSPGAHNTEWWKQDNVVLSGPHASPIYTGPTSGLVTEDSVTCHAVRESSVRDRRQVSFLIRMAVWYPKAKMSCHQLRTMAFTFVCTLHASASQSMSCGGLRTPRSDQLVNSG